MTKSPPITRPASAPSTPATQSRRPRTGSAKHPVPPAQIAIVVSRYNDSITSRLLDGAVEAFKSDGGSPTNLAIIVAPGAYDLTALCDAAAASGRYAGIVALGCIIKGDTSHDQHIASAVVHGLTNITILSGVPITLGVLTVNTAQQARERAGLGSGKHGNKGTEAMNALVMILSEIARMRGTPHTPTFATARLPDKAAAARLRARAPSRVPARGGR